MNRWLVRLIALIGAAYPILVYYSLDRLPFAFLGVVLVMLALGRLLAIRRSPGEPLLVGAGIIAMATAGVYTLIRQDGGGVRFYPVLMSTAMLALFAWSLFQRQSIIERLARLIRNEFPPEASIYTRRVTMVWCVFFLCNGLIALWTALAADWATWTLYNGLVSYLLMGALAVGEYAFRQRHLGAASR